MDDEIAREQGYPSKILQGMCTFALCSRAVVGIGASGDPRRLRRLAGRFSAPAFPRHDLDVEVYDAGAVGGGRRALAFEATQEGVTIIKHGRAELTSD
jgi:acyl dehydratase